jgi:hypothetical protein
MSFNLEEVVPRRHSFDFNKAREKARGRLNLQVTFV